MSLTLHLGVVDVPYVKAPSPRQRKATASTVTTGQVAEWLENKYHIMEIFGTVHGQDIADDIGNSLAGAMESIEMGAPTTINPFGAAEAKITQRMQDFLSNNEMAKLGYPGVPTQASIDRAMGRKVSARRKRVRSSNAQPVSFIDSGLYQSSERAWID